MAGINTKNAGKQSTQRDRFLTGTDTPVVRLKSFNAGKGRMVWAVKEGSGFRRVQESETELC